MAVTSPSPALLRHHRDNNRVTADGWTRFADHRARQTDLVLGAGGRTLAVLGAGNCNDLDLERLTAAFDTVHLVDLDEEALRRAVARQNPTVAAKLVTRAPIDLSGAMAELPRWSGATLSSAHLARLARTAFDNVMAALPDRYDTVLSACLLSQIMHGCHVALGSHAQLAAIGAALAAAHLRALLTLARPGGRVVFVTDTVSSETYPLVELWGEQAPGALLAQLDQVNNVLSGTSVSFLRRVLSAETSLMAGRPRLIEPWLWQMHPDVTMLVYALICQRAPP
ncbi:MAG TPA: hypothetical protein VFH68_05600 [Polyangia bacterium]|nr:hypothetical protein [Polyangia bacterium]